MARLVVLFCWATGAVLQCAIGNLHVAEISLLRQSWSTWLQAGDVLLADRHYCSYVDLARLKAMGVFAVFRLHARRLADFRKGQRLGPDDRLVTWTRPVQWLASFGISPEQFRQLPETLQVRQIRITQVPRGFRSRTIVVVTTLLDPIAYPADEIRALFRDRWTAELNLGSLKIGLGMDVLRGETPDVVRKEMAHAPAGVQPDPAADVAGGPPARTGSASAEFRRHAASAAHDVATADVPGGAAGDAPGAAAGSTAEMDCVGRNWRIVRTGWSRVARNAGRRNTAYSTNPVVGTMSMGTRRPISFMPFVPVPCNLSPAVLPSKT